MKLLWLGLILILFLVTRIYKITEIPGSVYWDEASIGYNAFAITQDLKDEWGEYLPLHFRAFGEFKLPVYVYSVAIFTKIFGLGELAVRLPAVIFGAGIVTMTYLLVGPISAFILSVSPWFFIFSRTGYEATAGLFFFLLFVYFLAFSKAKDINYVMASVFAMLSFYSYNSFRILIPAFLLIWLVKTRPKFSAVGVLALTIFIISLIPVIKLYKYDQGASRFATVGIKDPQIFVNNYISHFNYKFLFTKGDINNRSQVPDWGQLYWIELPLFIIGLVVLYKSKNKFRWVFISFLILAAIPASLTRESPHALRAILLAPTFAMISGRGIKGILVVPVVIIYLVFFGYYYSDFLKNYNNETASDWQYEYKEIFSSIRSGEITDDYAQPYIFALYYQKVLPNEFRSTVKYNPVDKWGFSVVESFGNFTFK